MALRIGTLRPPSGSRRTSKRVGRGHGSGKGTYSGRGAKGQKSRSGKGPRPGFEGGQTPLGKKMPFQRGVRAYGSSHTGGKVRVGYLTVNLRDLARFPADHTVTPDSLRDAGLINREGRIKILGTGTLEQKLHVKAHAFSVAAKTAIEANGGAVEVLV